MDKLSREEWEESLEERQKKRIEEIKNTIDRYNEELGYTSRKYLLPDELLLKEYTYISFRENGLALEFTKKRELDEILKILHGLKYKIKGYNYVRDLSVEYIVEYEGQTIFATFRVKRDGMEKALDKVSGGKCKIVTEKVMEESTYISCDL